MIQFKRGDTFQLTGIQLQDANDLPIALDDIGIRAQARTVSGTKALEFSITKHSDSFDLDAGDTSTCPVGPLHCDIEYTFADGKIQSTEDFVIHCLEDRTR